MRAHAQMEVGVNWLFNHSLQAGLLVLVVLLVQWVFRRQLTHRWRFALWWIVLLRLLLPFSAESALSLFNFIQPHVRVEGLRAVPAAPVPAAAVPGAPVSRLSAPLPPEPVGAPVADSLPSNPASQVQPLPTPAQPGLNAAAIPRPAFRLVDLILPGLVAVWLAGVLGLMGVVAGQVWRFSRKLAPAVPAAGRQQQLLDDCRREFGLTRRITLRETDAVQSPALFGLFRLQLLMPRGFEGQFTERELRYIFFHELAHVKRGDLWLNWLVTTLQILHWFNPLLWLGFARLRADRELACDELALLRAGDQAGTAYGETVVKLLENLSRPAAIPGLIGILEDKEQMRRRIRMIARYRRPGRWSVLAVLLVAGVAAAALTDARTNQPPSPRIKLENAGQDQALGSDRRTADNMSSDNTFTPVNHNTAAVPAPPSARVDLTGTVSTRDGAPLPAPATVFMATAGPKVGTSPFCPSCYADCQKRTQTDAQGNFEIKALDPQLRFQVLVAAKGFKPQYVDRVDPTNGPIQVKLDPIEMAAAPPGNCLYGRVVDTKGKPVAGAVVEAHGLRTRDGGGHWGSLPGVDPLAVADENGDFLLTSQKPFEQMDVKVLARGFANQTVTELASGSSAHSLVLTEGAAVRGRVMVKSQPKGQPKGQPLTNVLMGVVSVNRDMIHFTGNFEVGTDSDGRFLFVNLPPDTDYFVYGLMDSLESLGAISIQKFRAGKDGELADLGELVTGPAYRLAGRVELADGTAIPPQTRLLVSRENAWDSRQVLLSPEGRFELTGVPPETLTLGVRVKGYRVSAKNASLDPWNPYQLVGRMGGDLTNLVFLLEKGENLPPDHNNNTPEAEWPRNQPLHGTEGGAKRPSGLAVTGRVTDRQTGEPVAHLLVTPGAYDLTWQRSRWVGNKAVEGPNGSYTVYLDPKWGQPVLKVEAEGYLPASVRLRPLEQTNADLVLERGVGPAGTVVTPAGVPVTDAEVLLVCADSDQTGMNYDGHLRAWQNAQQLTKTDASGHFALAPQLEMSSLVIAATNGFSRVALASLATNTTLVLEPYGMIQGTLTRPTGPGAKEDLDLAFVSDGPPGFQRFNLAKHAVTDAAGRFEFDRVPAGRLQLSYRVKMSNPNSWQNNPLQQVTLNPGQTLITNITAPARQLSDPWGGQRIPEPAPVPGEKIVGSVRLPNGQPAAGAQVAVQVPNKYLALGKATFKVNTAWQDGSAVHAGPDGKFSLPMYAQAQSVIALSDEGYAQVSLADLKRAPQITLQPWGRIEGTLRLGQHPATNTRVILSTPPEWVVANQRPRQAGVTNMAPEKPLPPLFDFSDFQAQTDEQGRFVISYIPPGKQTIARLVPAGNNSQMHSPLGTVQVKPGETTKVQLGGGERLVTGKVVFADGAAPKNLSEGTTSIHDTNPTNRYVCPVKLSDDGSFQADNVAPGKYVLDIYFRNWQQMALSPTNSVFVSAQEIVIPAAGTNDDSPVNLGTIELKPPTRPAMPVPPAQK